MRNVAGHTDSVEQVESWAAAAAKGDTEAMGYLYERYVDAIYRHVHLKTRDHAKTEDICSDVWVRVVRAIGSYSPSGKGFPAWLYTIASNTTVDYYRRAKPVTPSGDMLHLDSPSIEVGPEEAAVRSEVAGQIAAAMKNLTDKQQLAITLRFFEGLTLAEAADVMQTTVSDVKTNQHRGLRALAKILPEEMRILGASLGVTHVRVVRRRQVNPAAQATTS